LNCDNTKLNNLLQAYKNHLVLLISQNKKIAAEIQYLIGRDNELRNILGRDDYLQNVRFENNSLVSSSLEKIKPYLDTGSSQMPPDQGKTVIKRTYSFERNDNRNNNIGNDQNIISNMNNNISQSRINSGIGQNMNGSGMNQGMGDNMSGSMINPNQEGDLKMSQMSHQDNMEEQDQGGEEEMINMDENEQENEQENEAENEHDENM
jgi:hypothetical protein